ncbi:MAG: phage distal tail protein, Rcc01695 family [Beijerinckiaceae bacterium]
MSAFHEVRFPVESGLRSKGGPERRTDIVTLGSGREERNARWAHARRRYDAGYGVRSLASLSAVVAFFEERRGRLYGFRFKDRTDFRSSSGASISGSDQLIGTGTGTQASFALIKTYGSGFAPYARTITKPVAGSLLVMVAGVAKLPGTHCDVDITTGIVTFRSGHIPTAGQAVTAGFEFDVPVRFDTDRLDIDLASFDAGEIPSIPLIEIVV